MLLPALSYGCFAVCHTLCYSYSLRSDNSCDLHPTSFISSFVSFITPCSLPSTEYKGMKHLVSILMILLSVHPFVSLPISSSLGSNCSLRHPFSSVWFSSPVVHYFARLACLLWLRVCHAFCNKINREMLSVNLSFLAIAFCFFQTEYPFNYLEPGGCQFIRLYLRRTLVRLDYSLLKI